MVFLLILLFLFLTGGSIVRAEVSQEEKNGQRTETESESGAELETLKNELRSDVEENWNEIESFLQGRYAKPADDRLPSFSEMVHAISKGDLEKLGGWIRAFLEKEVLREIRRSSQLTGQVLALGILAAVFAGFSRVFPGEQVAGTAGFMTYLLLVTVLAAAGSDSAAAAAAALQSQMEFVRALLPSYCLAVAWAGSAAASAAWMELLLFVLTIMERFYLTILLPLTKGVLLLVFVGNMVREEMLQKMTELWKGIILWGARALPAFVAGFQLIQGMVLPVADAVGTSGFQKLLGMIPGIGAGTGAAAKLLLGSGVLIKNSMGAAAVLILGLVSVIPLFKLRMLLLLLRLSSAVLQPVADRRTVAVISGTAEVYRLLFGLVFYGMIVYVLAIALVCASTNAAWMAV